jgi:hypothetical protein
MQQRGQSQDRRRHVRDDAEGAAKRRDDAGTQSPRETGGQRVEHAGARGRDHNQRREQKLDTHGAPLRNRFVSTRHPGRINQD